MKIIATVKQVPSTQSVTIDPQTGTMDRTGVPSIMNPPDKHALEAALRLKTVLDEPATVIALSMGPPQADGVLREALAMGADRAVLLCDPVFAGADTLATAYTLSRAIKKIQDPGVILCGHHSLDGETGQVGPQLAGFLNLPQVTHADSVTWHQGRLIIRSNFQRLLRIVDVVPPVLITVSTVINAPRYKTMNGVLRAFRDKTVEVWGQGDLDLNPYRIGINGSPTRVRKIFHPTFESRAAVHAGDPLELADGLLKLLVGSRYI